MIEMVSTLTSNTVACVALFLCSCCTAGARIHFDDTTNLVSYMFLIGMGVSCAKLLLYPEPGLSTIERHRSECAVAGSLVVLVSSTMDLDLSLSSYVSWVLVLGFVTSHALGVDKVEPMVYVNVVLAFLRAPSVLNVAAFAFAYSGLVALQTATVTPLALEVDPRAGFINALRVAYLLHISGTWLGIGLIHVMIEFYRRYVPMISPFAQEVI